MRGFAIIAHVFAPHIWKLGALRMFNLHGMKWPKSKEFVQSERAVGELKVLNFSLGVPLIILTFLLKQPDLALPVIGNFKFLIFFCGVLFLLASWMEDYPIFSLAAALTSCFATIGFTLFCIVKFTLVHGFTSSTAVSCFFIIYAGIVSFMVVRAFKAHRT